MTNMRTPSVSRLASAALALATLSFGSQAKAATIAFISINGVDLKLKSVNSGDKTILQWKNDGELPITSSITGLSNIQWKSEGCLRIQLNTGGGRYVLSMASG